MASTKKPPPLFEVVFEKRGLYPEAIPVGALERALAAVRRLAAGSEGPSEDDEQEGEGTGLDDATIRLLGVRRGSAAYQFVGPSENFSLEHLRAAGRALENPDAYDDGDYAIRPIELLSAVAKRLDCELVIREAGSQGAVLATIQQDSYSRLAGRLFLTGDTSLTGCVERAGGATTMRCALRIASRPRLLFCKVANKDAVRQLGLRLYEEVAVTGKAQWLRHNWKIIDFTIYSVYQPQCGSIADAFKALRDAGGHGWDGVADPSAYIEEVTGK